MKNEKKLTVFFLFVLRLKWWSFRWNRFAIRLNKYKINVRFESLFRHAMNKHAHFICYCGGIYCEFKFPLPILRVIRFPTACTSFAFLCMNMSPFSFCAVPDHCHFTWCSLLCTKYEIYIAEFISKSTIIGVYIRTMQMKWIIEFRAFIQGVSKLHVDLYTTDSLAHE